MELERPHRTTSSNSNSSGSTSELFICFTSRLSSSSMKISSKSILSPGRAREPSQISLSSSLSRRLKNSGSIKGGQASPMFPTGGKKKGCAFDNPEPSSPKVTCIGQVRVKTKKQGKKMRIRSKRRSSEPSFRKSEQNSQSISGKQQENQNHENNHQGFQFQNLQQQECLPHHRNQRWVHLPLTICEALRAFGAEFNCFLPCRSSCMTSEKDKEEKGGERSVADENGSSCGAVFARWLVALQDGDGKGREIELVVGEEERTTERRSSSRRRQMLEGIEIKEESKESGMEDEEGRVSICIPPKNALLLMRCRSDPVKMAALANRFWESPAAPKNEEGEDEEEDGDDEDGRRNKEAVQDDERGLVKAEVVDRKEVAEQQANLAMEEEEEEEEVAEEAEENPESSELDEQQQEIVSSGEDPSEESEGEVEEEKPKGKKEDEEEEEEEEEQELEANQQLAVEKESVFDVSLSEILVDAENVLDEEENAAQLVEKENSYEQKPPHQEEEKERELKEERRASVSKYSSEPVKSVEQEPVEKDNIHGVEEGEDKAENEIEAKFAEAAGSTKEEKETREETVIHQKSKPEYPNNTHEEVEVAGSEPKVERESSPVLPDCLRLMMCEPKLSMEVSKETWVCSTDFVRWLPERKVNQRNGLDQPKKHQHHQQQQQLSIINNEDSNSVRPCSKQLANQLMQPPRSSCSFPAPAAPASMATVVEEKLVGSKGYEPFVLTRCKSEPMRSSAKFPPPDACFWKNRKLEPHRPATLGVGAAGVGF